MNNNYDSIPANGEYSVPIRFVHEELATAFGTIANSESQVLLERYIENYSQQIPREREGIGCLSGMWYILGFKYNPLLSSSHSSRIRNSSAADMRLAMLSNFSTAYNIVSISLALHMMDSVYLDATSEDKALCSSALIAGMIVGQLGGGTLGDVLGRHVAMTCVMFLQVVSAFFSALSTDFTIFGFEVGIYSVLAVWRFILGIGAGGVYPLAATITSESTQTSEERGKSVALTFAMQGVGYLVVPLIAWITVEILGLQSDYSWRLLLAIGALPGVFLTIARASRSPKKKGDFPPKNDSIPVASRDDSEEFRTAPVSIVDAILIEPNLLAKLIGTGGCWFLFDILFYGNTLFQPMVLSSVFGAAETVDKVARDTTMIACMALPGYIVSIAAIGRQSPRFIQLQGFLIMGILYAAIGFYFHSLAKSRCLMLTLYSLTFFWSNYGPNATVGFRLASFLPCKTIETSLFRCSIPVENTDFYAPVHDIF